MPTEEEIAAEKALTEAAVPTEKVEETPENKEVLTDAELEQLLEDTPEENKEATPQVETLSEEDKGLLNKYKALKSNQEVSAFLDLVENGGITEFVNKVIPKGKDYSKLNLSDKEIQLSVYKEWLTEDGVEGDDLENEIKDFEGMKRLDKKAAVEKAVKELSTKKPSIPVEWQPIVQNESKRIKTLNDNFSASQKEASNLITKKLDTLVDKDYHGIKISKEDAVSIFKLAQKITPVDGDTITGVVKHDATLSSDVAVKAYTFDKVVADKDKQIAKLKNTLKLRFRPNAEANGANGNSGRENLSDAEKKARDEYYKPIR